MDYVINDTLMTSIADAIRDRSETTAPIEASDMPDLIRGIDYKKIYGFHLDSTEDDPDACITYLADAIGRTPAYMDFTNDTWNWGGWEEVFFIPKPCMVKYDGTVDYYLDSSDYTKKIDGTASDVADTTYGGNAMMEFPKIWMKIVPDTDPTSASIYFANYKADKGYTCFPYIDADGNEIDKMYVSIYNGSNVDGTLRSISGLAPEQSKTTTQQISEANANNRNGKTEWNIGLFSDRLLINFLTVLITKSLNCKGKIGKGIQSDSQTVVNNYRSGTLNNKGLFYGKSSDTTTAVKVFGIENWYALQWDRTLGLIDVSGRQMVKLCYGQSDGSTTDSYNQNGSNYIDTKSSSIFSSSTSGWLKFMTFSDKGYAIASTDSGAESKRYCSYIYENPTITTLALFGGDSYDGSRVSLFTCILYNSASAANWGFGASLSLKPLAG